MRFAVHARLTPSLICRLVVVELDFNTSNTAEDKSQTQHRCNFCFRAITYPQQLDVSAAEFRVLLLLFQSESSCGCETRPMGPSFSRIESLVCARENFPKRARKEDIVKQWRSL